MVEQLLMLMVILRINIESVGASLFDFLEDLFTVTHETRGLHSIQAGIPFAVDDTKTETALVTADSSHTFL